MQIYLQSELSIAEATRVILPFTTHAKSERLCFDFTLDYKFIYRQDINFN